MVKFIYNGHDYDNAVELAKNIPLMTSVLVGYTEDAEILCANAAGICYDTEILADHENGPWVLDKKGQGILKHCRDSRHNTVLEHGCATFLKKVPIFVARQDLRSRIASFDERSLRYCRANDGTLTYYIPDYLEWDYISKLDTAGKHLEADMLVDLRMDWIGQHERAVAIYSKYTDDKLTSVFKSLGIGEGRVKETMRSILPIGINTMYMDTRNLWSWIHHAGKRLCLRAQKEMRIIMEQQVKQLREVYPTIFNDVKRPCQTPAGCPEKVPCKNISNK